MQTHNVTSPFGRRTMTLAMIARQAAARQIPATARANKWKVFQHIREARDLIGATDRALAILNALLSFHPETELSGSDELIVWPSNEQLMARANGMPATTLRRHLAVLVECGLIIRRDSPNGKRFARKSDEGKIEQAYGFDLSPIVARAAEFEDMADTVREERKALRVAREKVTLLRRDIVKMIETAIEEKVPGNWGRVTLAYQEIISRLPRLASLEILAEVTDELHQLWSNIREALESFANSQIPDVNESHSGAHIQNSNPDSIPESENGSRKRTEAAPAEEAGNVRMLPVREMPLSLVLDACPAMREFAEASLSGGTIRQWRDFLAAAELVRPMLGVSPSAWRAACHTMGEQQAAITLAAIYQRSGQIANPGGYLRNLTERAGEGKFSTWPMIMALLRARMDAGGTSGAVRSLELRPSAPGGTDGPPRLR
ncbi:plasmid replication protein RepC [Aminobacter sp. J41]|uniref:plasmid replication protein RepC n=1 Tax=Aminobacter sp. J41 TaxID=935261 RepID=UPI000467A1DD|nr:plasmid replication protein RepC [Aminobacter sp. J41]